MSNKRKAALNQMINAATITFKAFDYSVNPNSDRSQLWHFETHNQSKSKRYVVHCTLDINDVGDAILSILMKKTPPKHRLVIICRRKVTEEEVDEANTNGYALVGLNVLKKFGAEMIDLQNKNIDEGPALVA